MFAKNYIIIILLGLIACGPELNKNDESVIIKNTLFEQVNQWNNGNMEGFIQAYDSTELIFMTSKGIIRDRDSLLSSYKKSYPTKNEMGNLSFKILETEIFDKMHTVCRVLGEWHVSKDSTQQEGLFSLILKKKDDQWKIVMDHTF